MHDLSTRSRQFRVSDSLWQCRSLSREDRGPRTLLLDRYGIDGSQEWVKDYTKDLLRL